MNIDPDIHQPVRLRILMLLSGVSAADFVFLRNTLGLSQGNLSSHMSRLESVGYVEVTKTFEGRMPNTSYWLTKLGRSSLKAYWEAMDGIRGRR